MSVVLLYLLLGTVVTVSGLVRMLLVPDLMARLVAMNLVGTGSLLILLALAARSEPTDPVLSALVITGLVITVAFTGFGAVLIRGIEQRPAEETPGQETPAQEVPAQHHPTQQPPTQHPPTQGGDGR